MGTKCLQRLKPSLRSTADRWRDRAIVFCWKSSQDLGINVMMDVYVNARVHCFVDFVNIHRLLWQFDVHFHWLVACSSVFWSFLTSFLIFTFFSPHFCLYFLLSSFLLLFIFPHFCYSLILSTPLTICSLSLLASFSYILPYFNFTSDKKHL